MGEKMEFCLKVGGVVREVICILENRRELEEIIISEISEA
jgi:hypothetical protein